VSFYAGGEVLCGADVETAVSARKDVDVVHLNTIDSSQVLLIPLWLAMSEHYVQVEVERGRSPSTRLGAPNFCSAKIWWSRWESNPRPLECHPISARNYSLPRPVTSEKLRTSGFCHRGHVPTRLRVFSDKRRTVINFIRLIGSQDVHLIPIESRAIFFLCP
jgi:hypothetical protein